jgi:hypothetical protein
MPFRYDGYGLRARVAAVDSSTSQHANRTLNVGSIIVPSRLGCASCRSLSCGSYRVNRWVLDPSTVETVPRTTTTWNTSPVGRKITANSNRSLTLIWIVFDCCHLFLANSTNSIVWALVLAVLGSPMRELARPDHSAAIALSGLRSSSGRASSCGSRLRRSRRSKRSR